MSNGIDRRTALGVTLAGVLGSLLGQTRQAEAATVVVYDAYGNRIVIDTATLSGPVTYYNAAGAPYVVYPAAPAYVPAPVYGPAGVRGQARRVSRRTSRRVSRRR